VSPPDQLTPMPQMTLQFDRYRNPAWCVWRFPYSDAEKDGIAYLPSSPPHTLPISAPAPGKATRTAI